jgi:hypothetical protein
MQWRTSAVLLLLTVVGCSSSTNSTGAPSELIVNAPIPGSGTTNPDCSWTQLGQNAAHTGSACAPAQGYTTVLATITFDPFVEQEVLDTKAQEGEAALTVHYQAPLVTGDDVYVETKSGTYSGSADWNTQVWGETYYQWQSGALVKVASFESDWAPEPVDLVVWEPLFHAALDGNILWVPGAGGTVYKVDRTTMLSLGQVNPFATVDPNTFVSGPITVGPDGAIFYNVVHVTYFQSDPTSPPQITDVTGSLVRIEPDNVTVHAVDYASLWPGAPAPTDSCLGAYYNEDPESDGPWPPADDHRVSVVCGSLRPGVNVAPAVGADGTVFTVASPNNAPNAGVLLALNANLSPKWSATLQEIFNDGCGVLVPADAETNGGLPDGGTDLSHCRVGAPLGVDPDTGQMPSDQISDQSSSSPVVLPDGSVLYGGLTYYNNYRGHLVKFDATGKLLANYDDGWDQSPAVWPNAGSYSIIVKDNHYSSWYSALVGPYDITQVDANLEKQWSYTATNTYSCQRQTSGSLSCTSDHPQAFEWCVNAPAVDSNGTVYVNSEDGRAYAILQGGTVAQSRFLVQSLAASYTPSVVDGQGRAYSMNGGVLTVVGK